MMYNFIFEPDFARIIPAINIDSRASIPSIKNHAGSIIKNFNDYQLSLLGTTSITYKIETDLGVLAGFFSISVDTTNQTASLIMQQFRPAFNGFTELTQQISNFIQGVSWKQDFLF